MRENSPAQSQWSCLVAGWPSLKLPGLGCPVTRGMGPWYLALQLLRVGLKPWGLIQGLWGGCCWSLGQMLEISGQA